MRRSFRSKTLTLRAALIVGMAVLFLTTQAQSAVITWSGSTLIGDGTSDINATGALVEAHNLGFGVTSTTAGGVLFDNTEPNPFGSIFAGANPNNITGDTNFDVILNSASFSTGSVTYVIDALISGNIYLVQFFTTDNRTCCGSRTVQLDDGAGNSITSGPMDLGFAATGTFTAVGTTQIVNFTVASSFQIIPIASAWQLRDISNLRSIPEPATLTLFAFGLVGLGFMTRRRRKVAT